MTQVKLEPVAPRSRVKHSTTEPMRSQLKFELNLITTEVQISDKLFGDKQCCCKEG